MPFLTTAYIQSMLGGATAGAAKITAFGDTAAINAWIARADAEVVSAANRGGYSSVVAATPTPSSGPAFNVLVSLAFDEWWALANLYGREIDVGYKVGESSAKLYVDSPSVPRLDLPGIDRDALGGTSGGEIVNGSDLTTDTPSEPRFTRTSLTGFA